MVIAGGLAGWLLRTPANVIPPRLIQFTIHLPDGFSSELAATRQDFAVSPDGTRLAFVASDISKSQLFVRELAALDTRPLAPDRNVRGLVWAPDSRSLYFDERNALRQITLDGNVAQTICELPLRSPWMGLLRSGRELTLFTRAGTFRIPGSGGTPKRLDNAPYRWTQALPGGYLLNVRFDERIGRYLAMASSLTNPRDERTLLESDSKVAFAPLTPGNSRGHLLYVSRGTLVAHPFDARSLRLMGDPAGIVEDVFSFSPTGAAAFSVSENGVLVYRSVQGPSRLNWLDRTGRELGTVGKPAIFMTPFRLSPNGRELAATVYEAGKGGFSLVIDGLSHGAARRLVTGTETEAMAVWSPDGRRVAFGRAFGSTPKLYVRSTDNGAPATALPQAPFQLPTDWSRDGRFVLYQTTGGAGEPGADVFVADLSANTVVPLLHSEAQEFEAVLSPDSSTIAFISDETGRPELYIQSFSSDPAPHVAGQKRQVSREGASVIRWRADGRELFYIDGANWVTAVQAGMDGSTGPARKLFRLIFPPRQLTAAGPAFRLRRVAGRPAISRSGAGGSSIRAFRSRPKLDRTQWASAGPPGEMTV
jgi:Tol biopolymer transport system component